ncbi:MAG TPA: OBAP family protein [Enhygromyxa sp.]|nr:OBAP family protein [Enhygromyxa sp.]
MLNPNTRNLVFLCAIAALGACQRDKKSPETEVIEAGAEVLQSEAPIRAISTYLDGVHFYNGEMDEQVEAHHYVTILSDDVMQAVLFDGNDKNARMIGVEYIISQKLFEQLPDEEKKLWHSHAYEVKSGLAITPGLPAAAERALMEKLVSTYGKTWHTWHTQADENVPIGIPALMMAFTADGQIDPELLVEREQRLGVSIADIAARRADIPQPEIDPLADVWQQGEVIQLEAVTLEDED